MEPKKRDQGKPRTGKDTGAKDPYDLDLPLWRNYYQRVRRSIRFPRYYKKSLNW